MTRLVVLISGTGRNLEAIIAAQRAGHIQGKICAVISNNPEASGLAHAVAANIPTAVVNHHDYVNRASFDAALVSQINRYSPDFLALAGFMRILGSEFVQHYRGKLLNIHPSLLPKYPGLQTHARVLAEGETWHGASVHFVTAAVDGGPVIVQGRVAIQPGDSVASLSERVMQAVERVIYPEALAWACAGRLQMRENQVVLDGNVLTEPVQFNGNTMEIKHG